jgi:hypothetical protein
MEMGIGDFVKAYSMHQQMMLYPHLLSEMRALFLSVLNEKGIISPSSIRQEAMEKLNKEGLAETEENIKKFVDALIDLYFAHSCSEEEIENYIHLARKQEAFDNLNRVVNAEGATFSEIRLALKQFCQVPQGSLYIPPSEAEGVRVALINHFISNQLPFIGVAKHHITIRDVDELLDHSFWNPRRTGRIGGKAAGMYLAHKVLLPRLEEKDPTLEQYIAIPESYYLNSGILSDFIDHNRFYYFHSQKYKSRETIQEEYANMAPLLEKAAFPADVVEDFRRFLGNVRESPLILRSSSLLEDNIGYAFSGKYDSVFVANQGDLETRLSEFMWGLKRVLMSTFSPAAIMYRRDHNLLDFDERMSVLVQKVVGRRFGPYYFPFAAGVAFSQNAYLWSPRIVKEEGLVRLVLGLGTRAVDRVGADYPRMVPLSHPTLRPEITTDRIKKYSQKMVDVLNLNTRRLETISYLDLFRTIGHPELFYGLSVEEGGHLSKPLFSSQEINLLQSCITFDNFLAKTPFVPLIKKVLKRLESAYGRPVDVEFAWDNDKLYILQCRSLAVSDSEEKVILPKDIPEEQMLFTNNRGVFDSITRNIEFIVYVDPRSYAELTTFEERLAIGGIVSKLNRVLEGKRYALLGPTRWGSNDIKYGVKVGYEDINRTLILGEIAFEEEGSTPEVSYGTHFFNDLVEAKIVPLAIYPDQQDTLFKEEFFMQSPNLLASLAAEFAAKTPIVHVIHVPSCTGGRLLQVFQDGREQKGVGFLAFPHENRAERTSKGLDNTGSKPP